uniref:Lysozyme n=1 Tax=Leptobrachium leishanense TaxID=445787 RepID=A0A8C5QSA6_9ANUR
MRMFLLLLFLLAPAVKSWMIDRCTLAQELRNGGIVGYKSYTLEDCVNQRNRPFGSTQQAGGAIAHGREKTQLERHPNRISKKQSHPWITGGGLWEMIDRPGLYVPVARESVRGRIDMCLALHSSNYDTSLNASPTEYGVFQINSYWWCNDGVTVSRKNMCGMVCTNLLDKDVKDDIKCLGRIIKESAGLAAWDTYNVNCKGKDFSYLTADC